MTNATTNHDSSARSPSTASDGDDASIPKPHDLSFFKHEILLILAREGPSYGLKVKRELEDAYDDEVNHGRLYPNLDELVERDLVAKSERDKRTNDYRLTSTGRYLIREDAERRSAIAKCLKPGEGGDN
jgi:DNA-binding PadR family transcriptional regulator